MKTPAQRQAEYRARKAAQGAREVRGIYATDEQAARIKAYARKLIKKA